MGRALGRVTADSQRHRRSPAFMNAGHTVTRARTSWPETLALWPETLASWAESLAWSVALSIVRKVTALPGAATW